MNEEQLKKKLDKIAVSHKGRGGGPDSESYLHDAKVDREDGFVWVSTDNNLAAKLVKRCKDDIVDILDRGDGFYEFKIRRKAFRGIEYSFRTGGNGKKKNPTWLWAKKEESS